MPRPALLPAIRPAGAGRPRRSLALAVTLASLAVWIALPAAAPKPLSRGDLRWLGRVTFGVDTATVAEYQRLGRDRYLAAQLAPAADPASLQTAVAAIPVTQRTAEAHVKSVRAEQQRINALPTEDAKQQARMALNQAGAQAVYETAKRHLLRALASPSQLREQMTWFWMNHFSVFSGKANVRWELAEYEEQLRTLALGRFRDLVMATVTAPAMLEYLDNAQSAANRLNENYARELMELHTLGVAGGPSGARYTQQDVQELARILTGVGINATDVTPKLPPDRQALYIRRGLFEFNPMRHDMAPKSLLGQPITGRGFEEVERAVDAPVPPAIHRSLRQPQARDVLRRRRSAGGDRRPDGAHVCRRRTARSPRCSRRCSCIAISSTALAAPAPKLDKFKDPMQFVVSSLRLGYDGKVMTMTNFRPMVGWLQQLGQPLYGRVTPDGYALTEAAWTSSGQMVRRFEIARAIGSGGAGLFTTDDNKPGPNVGFPMLTSRFYYDTIEPALRAPTRAALGRTASQQEWNTMLLASPDWMQR